MADRLAPALGTAPTRRRDLAYLDGLLSGAERKNGWQLATLVGVAPLNRDRGQFRGCRTIRGGRAQVRKALYMATLSATRVNPVIQTCYRRRLQASGARRRHAQVADPPQRHDARPDGLATSPSNHTRDLIATQYPCWKSSH